MNELMWLFVVPFLAAIVALAWNAIPKWVAVLLSSIPLFMLLWNYSDWLNASVHYPWMPALSINFSLKVDGLSLVFLFLTAIVIPISFIATPRNNTFYGFVLLLQGLLIGFFTARDLVLFTFFWEAMLLPLYFIITLWGGSQRQQAALKFLIYMIAGSALMIAAVLALYFGGKTFDLDALSAISTKIPYAAWVCAIFFLAFAVKTPLFPFHAWLPDAYCQASIGGTILLSAILSKAGIYGFARIGLELFPSFMQAWSPLLLTLAIVGVFYGGLAAWSQSDFKRLVAYSSFSHVNFVLAGLFAVNATATSGAILQAFNHGITITGLFLVAYWLEQRLRSTEMGTVGGLAKFMPHLCWLTLFFVLSSVALPGTNNFIGELLILFGIFTHSPWPAVILSLSIILSVMYMLRWMQQMYFQAPGFYQESWTDIKWREFAIALPLALLILWIGIYPAPALQTIDQKNSAIALELPSHGHHITPR